MNAVGARRGPGLLTQIAAAYPDFRAAMARKLAWRPGEAQLLSYALLAGFLGFVADLPSASGQAQALGVNDGLSGVLAGRLFAALFLFPLLLYGAGAASHLVSRAAGGRGDYATARLALFWSVMVGLPLMLADGALAAILPAIAGAPGEMAAGIISAAAALGFAWIWAACLAEVEGFCNTWRVFVGILFIPVSIMVFSLLFSG